MVNAGHPQPAAPLPSEPELEPSAGGFADPFEQFKQKRGT
jgi:hypothetical protein